MSNYQPSLTNVNSEMSLKDKSGGSIPLVEMVDYGDLGFSGKSVRSINAVNSPVLYTVYITFVAEEGDNDSNIIPLYWIDKMILLDQIQPLKGNYYSDLLTVIKQSG